MSKDWYSIPERMVDLLAAQAAGIFLWPTFMSGTKWTVALCNICSFSIAFKKITPKTQQISKKKGQKNAEQTK